MCECIVVSMGIIMSSLPVLEPIPEPMDTDVPSEEVRHSILCMCVYCNILMVIICLKCYLVCILW